MPKDLVSMAYTKAEIKKKNSPKNSLMACSPGDGPKYPYGLKVCIENDTLEKLGIENLPKVGKRMTLTALVEVCSVSAREEQDGDEHKNLDLQIVKMSLAPATDSAPDKDDPDYISKMQDVYGDDEE